MKNNKSIKIFCVLLSLLLLTMIAFAPQVLAAQFKDQYTTIGKYSDYANVYEGTNISNYSESYSQLNNGLDTYYPTICNAFGSGSEQIFNYEDYSIKAHTITNEVILIDKYDYDANYNITDIFCNGANEDTNSRDYLFVVYNDTSGNTKIDTFVLSGSTIENAELTKVETVATFDAFDLVTEVHCSESTQLSNNVDYFCVVGGDDNKIRTISSDTDYNNYEISVSGLNIITDDATTVATNEPSGFKPNSVISSINSENEIIVLDIQPVTSLQTVLSLDFDDCASTSCTLSGGSVSTWTQTIEHSGTRYIINGMSGHADINSAFVSNNKVFYSEYEAVFMSGELYDNDIYFRINFLNDATLRLSEDLTTNEHYTSTMEATQINTPIIKTDLDFDGDFEYCPSLSHTRTSAASTYTSFKCAEVDENSGIITPVTLKTSILEAVNENYWLVGQTLNLPYDSDYSYKLQLVYYVTEGTDRYMTLDTDTTYQAFEFTDSTAGAVYSVDLNHDGENELLLQYDDTSILKYNRPPFSDTILHDDTINYTGLYGFYNPAKVNVTQTIKAKECGVSETSCTYRNNDSPLANEKLCTTCGGTQSLTCGIMSPNNPQVECNFTSTGTYDVSVLMYTSTNEGVLAETFYIEDWVINTENQSLDNLVEEQDPTFDEVTPDGEDEEDTETSVDGLSGVFAALQNNIKSIFAILIIVVILGSVASKGIRNPVILLFIGILLSILMVIIGMLDATILVYILIAAVIMIVLAMTVFKTNNNG